MVGRFLLPVLLLLPSFPLASRASFAVPPIGSAPLVPVIVSTAAQQRLRAMLDEGSDRGAGNVRPTGSMRPAFDERSIVVVEKTPWEDLQLGDVVLFSSPAFRQQTIAHRIVLRTPRHWRTRGDASRTMDPDELTPDNYHGYRVIAAIDRHTGEVRWSAK